MLLLFILKILTTVYKVKYFTLSDGPISKNLFNYRKFRMKFNDKNFVFSNGSKKYITDACMYSVISPNSFGHLYVCNQFKGLICTDKNCIEIEAVSKNNPRKIRVREFEQQNIEFRIPERYKSGINSNGFFVYNNGKVYFKNNLRLSRKKIIELRIGLINEYERYNQLQLYAYNDALEIFNSAKNIIENLEFNYFTLTLVNTIIISRTESNLLPNKKSEAPLEDFEKNISKLKEINTRLQSSDLLVLVTNDAANEQEGLSYYQGMKNIDTRYIIINLDPQNTAYYKGKILVHEILHTLGSLHDKGSSGFLMDELFVNKNDKEIRLSDERRHEVEAFVLKNMEIFTNREQNHEF
jgi:hypothetical protein